MGLVNQNKLVIIQSKANILNQKPLHKLTVHNMKQTTKIETFPQANILSQNDINNSPLFIPTTILSPLYKLTPLSILFKYLNPKYRWYSTVQITICSTCTIITERLVCMQNTNTQNYGLL